MERTPTFLAALASAAVPGLDPVSVEALPSVAEQDYDVAFVQDSEHRRWVVRAPRTEAAGARMDLSVTLLQMLARRVPFAIPVPRGFVELKGGGRAMVYPFLPGHNLAFDELPAGPGPAADLGRALAALHNTDVRLFDEAGMPTYDTDSYRTRRLAELDRAAESGRVPTGLLARWERALEDVGLWRFAPTPVHGSLTGEHVLAVFEDDSDASTGRIRGITGWEDAKVADPADDFAAIVNEADPATVETVAEAYAHARVERPDPNLLVRARLAAELGVLAELMRADARGDEAAIEGLSTRLRRLDDEVHAEDTADDYRRTSLTPVALRARSTPPPIVEEDDEDDGVEFEQSTAGTDEDHSSAGADSAEADSAAVADRDGESAVGDPEDVVDEAVAPHEPEDVVVEDLSPDDEVAWTPRTLRSEPTVAIEVAREDSDDSDDSDDSAFADDVVDEPTGTDAEGTRPEDDASTRPDDAQPDEAEPEVTDPERPTGER
ncbi:macrolide 2'-phosphotransferase [Knoellia aerolata]|uniref:Aminoglycoside phosphotransferase n=1 Tax=Knoellia aerolata DSM 18566 TaxID=1385519 RepID=A0A0A0JZ52_9MICO|nr:macrolide 2'-phosphotransferase [Knoellia aerolata]KGN41362.1 aminoglycoside phosphotransferase [Knoellia aerolata DSM 18566]